MTLPESKPLGLAEALELLTATISPDGQNHQEFVGCVVHLIQELSGRTNPVYVEYECGETQFCAGDPSISGTKWYVPIIVKNSAVGFLKVLVSDPSGVYSKQVTNDQVMNALQSLAGKLSQSLESENARDELSSMDIHFRALLDELPMMAFYKDREGHYLACNRKFASSSGKTVAEMIGHTDTELFQEDEEKARLYVSQDREVMECGEFRTWEMERKLSDGKRWVQVIKLPVPENENGVGGVVGLIQDITERKLKELDLHRKTEKLSELLDSSKYQLSRMQSVGGFGTWEWVINDNKLQWSRGVYDIFGVDASHFKPTYGGFLSMIHPDDRQTVEENVSAALQGRSYMVCHRVIRPDGSLRVVQEQADVIQDEDGTAISMIGSVQDITELQETGQALAEMKTRYEALYYRSAFGIFAHDLDGRILDANPAGLEMIGYTPQDVGSILLEDLLEGEDLARIKANMNRVLRSEQPVENETYRIRRKDKKYRWVRADLHLLYDWGGQPETIQAIVKDVTALVEAEKKVRDILDSTGDGVIGMDKEGITIFVNRKAFELLGFSESEIINKPSLDVWNHGAPAGEHNSDHCTICRSLKTGKRLHREHEHFYRKDGTVFPISCDCNPLAVEEESKGIVVSFRDLTDHEKLDAQFRQAQKMDAVGRLASGVAHDFNNMLTAMGGFAELGLRKTGENDAVRPYLQHVLDAVSKSSDLTRQLLAFSRDEEAKPEIVEVNKLIVSIYTMLQRVVRADIHLEMDLDDTIEAVKVDPSQLDQVIMNLVLNARDAIFETKDRIEQHRILIQTRPAVLDDDYCSMHPGVEPGKYTVITVSDTGCGMDKATQERIFEPFFTTKRKGKGTGLGMATVFGVVKKHNGHIYVYSELGMGTTFKLHFPVHLDNGEEQVDIVSEELVEAVGTGRVLVVEDNPDILEFVTEGLRSYGFDVLQAESAEKAFQILAEPGKEVDLVFSDVVMSGMSGVQLAERIRQELPRIKTLLASGYNEEQAVGFGGTNGTRLIAKPYSIKDVVKAIQHELQRPESK
ncbi:MAG: PAS domain S-box protein [Acidobacteria bacterium]|nr:PAS domain S-box protein [Acidobacteriota bacterium]